MWFDSVWYTMATLAEPAFAAAPAASNAAATKHPAWLDLVAISLPAANPFVISQEFSMSFFSRQRVYFYKNQRTAGEAER